MNELIPAKITSYHIDEDKTLHTFVGEIKHVTFSEVNNDDEAQTLIDEENAQLKDSGVMVEPQHYPNNKPDFEAHTKAGNAIAFMFALKKDKDHKDRYLTSWGSKTAYGLTQVILRIAEDIKAGKEI